MHHYAFLFITIQKTIGLFIGLLRIAIAFYQDSDTLSLVPAMTSHFLKINNRKLSLACSNLMY